MNYITWNDHNIQTDWRIHGYLNQCIGVDLWEQGVQKGLRAQMERHDPYSENGISNMPTPQSGEEEYIFIMNKSYQNMQFCYVDIEGNPWHKVFTENTHSETLC